MALPCSFRVILCAPDGTVAAASNAVALIEPLPRPSFGDASRGSRVGSAVSSSSSSSSTASGSLPGGGSSSRRASADVAAAAAASAAAALGGSNNDPSELRDLVAPAAPAPAAASGTGAGAGAGGGPTAARDLPWYMPPIPGAAEATAARDDYVWQKVREATASRAIWASRWTKLVAPPPGDFRFDLLQSVPAVVAALKVDNQLRSARYDLVPSRISEDAFWRAFFYEVSRIKAELGTLDVRWGSVSSAGAAGKQQEKKKKEEEGDDQSEGKADAKVAAGAGGTAAAAAAAAAAAVAAAGNAATREMWSDEQLLQWLTDTGVHSAAAPLPADVVSELVCASALPDLCEDPPAVLADFEWPHGPAQRDAFLLACARLLGCVDRGVAPPG